MRQNHDLGERREVTAVLSRDLLADDESLDKEIPSREQAEESVSETNTLPWSITMGPER
ncbi:hypothetical protein ACFWFI_21160 [Streptomyces sp. NPDC060209]|uniref:hypothetical protein n=1 Tax=Streptomyces sp. NPDC060209 TaxID=3347073 RepID=UPI00365D68F5